MTGKEFYIAEENNKICQQNFNWSPPSKLRFAYYYQYLPFPIRLVSKHWAKKYENKCNDPKLLEYQSNKLSCEIQPLKKKSWRFSHLANK